MDENERTAIATELIRMKQGAIRATAEHDVAYYDGYLAADAVAVLPVGVVDRDAVLAQVGSDAPVFAAEAIEATRATVYSPDAASVWYEAVYPAFRAGVLTHFLRRNGEWRAVSYQQTILS